MTQDELKKEVGTVKECPQKYGMTEYGAEICYDCGTGRCRFHPKELVGGGLSGCLCVENFLKNDYDGLCRPQELCEQEFGATWPRSIGEAPKYFDECQKDAAKQEEGTDTKSKENDGEAISPGNGTVAKAETGAEIGSEGTDKTGSGNTWLKVIVPIVASVLVLLLGVCLTQVEQKV